MIHAAIVLPMYARAIASGQKTIEARLTRNRIAPFGLVSAGDRVYFKESSGSFVLTAIAADVVWFEGLVPRKVDALRKRYDRRVQGSAEYWERKREARYATFVTLAEIEPIAFGPDYRADPAWRPRSAWTAMNDDADVYPGCLSAKASPLRRRSLIRR